jgi:hypothetical protein
MLSKRYAYTDVDGEHFPDAEKHSEEVYAIDVSTYLEERGGTLVTALWEVSEEVTLLDSWIEEDQSVKAVLRPEQVGTFKITVKVTYTVPGASSPQFILEVPMKLKTR